MGVLEVLGLRESVETRSLRVQAAAAENLAEIMQESLADLELALEDRGWDALLRRGEIEFSRAGMVRIARLSRVMALSHPLIKRALAVRAAYVWGQGVQIQARAGEGSDQDVNAVVQAFLDDAGNRAAYTGDQAHETNERVLGTDGSFFLSHFTNPRTGFVQVRSLPFDEIERVICNPDDRDEPWFFERHWVEETVDLARGTTSMQQRVAYYPALFYRPTPRPKSLNGAPVMWDAPVLRVMVNALDGWQFGVPDAYAALDWARLYRDFLTDWAVLVKALSQIAWRATAPGSKAQRLRQALTRRPAGEVAPAGNPNTVGGTVTLPPDAKLEAVSKSGATIDSDSGRPLAAMIAAALGVPVTVLLADPGQTGARAVAETLDKPTELEMGMRRKVWEEAYRQSLSYVIMQAVKAPQGPLKGSVTRDPITGRETVVLAGDVDATIEFDWPPLTDTPIETLVKAIVEADSTQKLPPLEVAKLLLHTLGVKDVDELVAGMTDEDGNWIDPLVNAGQAAVDAYRRGEDPARSV